MFIKMCCLLPAFIATFLNLAPVHESIKQLDDPWNLKNAKIIASLPEEDIHVYAIDWKEGEKIGVYKEIALRTKHDGKLFSCLPVDTNPVWKPQLILSDIDNDDKKELIMITSLSGGIGIHEENVHVFRFTPEGYLNEIYVVNPLEGIFQNVKTEMTKKNGLVTINLNVKGKDYTMTAVESSLGNWGNEVGFGSMFYYRVVDNRLTVEMNVAVGNNVGIAEIIMDYTLENKRLRVDNVMLKKYDSTWEKWSN